MTLAIIGTLLNLFGAISIAAGGEFPVVGWVMMVPALISVVGIALAAGGSKKVGSYMIIGGAVIFVPLGLIAAFGGKQILNAHNEEQFEMEQDVESF